VLGGLRPWGPSHHLDPQGAPGKLLFFFVKLNTKKKFVSSSFVMVTRIVKNLFSCWPWRAFPLWQIPFAFIF
jgi:hypothetical protein